MYVSVRQRFLLLLVVLLALTIPAMADDVTISGTVNFSALDGSSLDHDGAANGTFTVSDGDLTVLGTINCNDDASTNACAMSFAVSGDFTMQPGAAIYAENRNGGGQGGNLSFTVGGNVVLNGSTGTLAGAVVSSSNHDTGAGSAGGNVTFNVGGTATVGSGAIVSAGAKGGTGGAIALTAGSLINVNGLLASGPSSTLTATRYTGAVLSGGSSTPSGGNITITSNSHTEPAITIGSAGVVISQAGSGNAGHVSIAGCGINVNGLVASISRSGVNAKVTINSGTTLNVNGQDLAAGAGSRLGMVRADALDQSAAAYAVNLFARENVAVNGPATGALYGVTSNGGTTSKDASGTITVISTEGAVASSGNAFAATNADSGDQGGTINIAAKNSVTLSRLNASGDQATNNPDRTGGTINVRSYSANVSWQNGLGDVRPTGSASGIAAAKQGTITVTYCTSYAFNGTSFPTDGAPVGPFPTTIQSCAAAAPALPAGVSHPDCNDPPVVVNDAYSVAEGGTLNVAAPGVLSNDVDPDGDPMTAVLVSGPAHATSFSLNADGSFTYVHNGGETSTDSFTYRATDGMATSSTATVVISISPVNDAPVANNDAYSVNEGGTINYAAPGVLANDSDSDGPSMSAVLVSGPANAASFVLNADGSFVYVHNGSETTSDSFTYRVSDGFLSSNVATVSISVAPVNDAPVANNDAYSVNEGGTLNGASVLANDTDPDSSLTAVLVSGPANASSFVLNANGTFTYVHNGSETTSDSFTYKANDGSANSNVATVTINVIPVNDAPVAAGDSYAVNEGGSLSIAAPGVLGNDTDADSGTLTAVLVSGPSNAATFALNANGSFSYTHNGSETATDSFTYKANDGAADSNVVTVTITINPVNDAPVANNDSASASEGGTLNGTSVLANDTDAENDALTATLVSGPAHASSFTLNADGTYTYVHDGSETTSDSFTYKANDGSLDSNVATVTITISPVNDAPVAVGDAYSVAEGGTLNGTSVVANDTDAENNSLTAVLVSGPTNASSFTLNADGTFTYVHNGSETTSDSFTYKANDGSVDSNVVTVTITITAVNDAPVAVADNGGTVAEGGTLNGSSVLANDSDAENDSLTAVLVSGPAHSSSFTLNADGTFTYTHDGGESTSDSFSYKASDGSLNSNTVTVSITITPTNDAPVAQNDGPYTISAGGSTAVAAPGVLANDSDVDSASLTAVLVSGPAHASSFTLNADGSFSYTNDGTTGSDSFTYVASDGSAQSNVATVTINVLAQPPTANADSYRAVGNTELRVGTGASTTPHAAVAGSVLANDTDPDTPNGSLIVSSFDATSANGGTVLMNPNGTFTYYPPVGSTATDTFNYVVTDGTSSSGATVTISFAARVWYVNNLAVSGDGRSHLPFSALSAAQAASAPVDYIYVHRGNGTTLGYASGITLQDGQKLIGSGVALVVGPYTLASAGPRPTIGDVVLADANTVAGTNVTGAGVGIDGNSISTAVISTVGISGGTTGIALTAISGSVTMSDVTVTPGGAGVVITGGTANITGINLSIVTSGFVGLSGTGSGTLTMMGGSVSTTNGTAVSLSNHHLGVALTSVSATNAVNGVVLSNTTGTFGVTGTGTNGSGGTISGMSGVAVSATNAAGLKLKSMNINNSAAQGVLVNNSFGTTATVEVRNASFTGNFSNAVQTANSGAGTIDVTVDNSTFANNAAAVVAQTTLGGMKVAITNNVATFNTATAFTITRNAGATGAVDATISDNRVGTAGVANSGAVCGGGCGAVSIAALSSGTFNTLVHNNVIYQVDGIAIRTRAGQGSGSLNATITNNSITQPVAGALNGINVQSGALSADTNATCATISGNTVSGGFGTDIRVINNGTSAGTTFSLPGYAGLGTDLTAVANFLKANNTITTASASRKTTAPQNQFSGGAPCATPAP